ncbi:polysaccharide deacetylase family protein [Urechidicola vernalis]|uniref:Polysaccharide deacetylase family protein n=1 Tax=Urechidicola vernalis TaxID=3075600 RepID=A0ABU2Y5Q8_9FLAO|nr:polysaccharide deacetylase family protein [Urechidicola sp. P050]MDT0552595.1 polysaccharide deacetylase family protein [Urechidicola sp. P050]
MDISEFIAHSGPKFSYSKKALGNEIHVRSHELLFEQGINDISINMSSWKEVPCFFMNNPKGLMPFDLFAASFYLISRYEEYLPYVQDSNERFPATESFAFKKGFLQKPLVDIWTFQFKEILENKFPDFSFKEREFEIISTIDVDNVFAYKHKGFVRNLGGFFKDFFTLKIGRLIERTLVLLRLRNDPFDTFDEIISLSKSKRIKTIFFFLIGDYTTYDTNVSSSNNAYRSLIKSMADYVEVGLHPSYYTMKNSDKLKKEKKRLEQIVNQPIQKSRQHYLRVKLPETYQNLIDLDVVEDYSMGYAKEMGFRASTCTPFYFYDLDFEIQTPLKIFPFAIMDAALNDYQGHVPTVAAVKIQEIKNEVEKVNGTFITLFHNESLSENERWKDWKKVYESIFD